MTHCGYHKRGILSQNLVRGKSEIVKLLVNTLGMIMKSLMMSERCKSIGKGGSSRLPKRLSALRTAALRHIYLIIIGVSDAHCLIRFFYYTLGSVFTLTLFYWFVPVK